MATHNDLLDEAQAADVDRFYLEMGSEASSSDPVAVSIASQVKLAQQHLEHFLATVKGKPVALVTV
jgi:hypothetical protein